MAWSILGAALGWVALGVAVLLSLVIVAALSVRAWRWCSLWRAHLRTRATPPRKGQVWCQDFYQSQLTITRIVEDGANAGRICMSSGNASWSDSPEEWRQRTRSRRLVLLKDGGP